MSDFPSVCVVYMGMATLRTLASDPWEWPSLPQVSPDVKAWVLLVCVERASTIVSPIRKTPETAAVESS